MSLFACQTLAVTLECRLHFCCFSCLRGLQFNLLIAKTSDIDRPLKAEVQRPTAHPCEHVHYDAFGPPTINPSSSPSSTGYCWCFCCFCRGFYCCPLLCGWWNTLSYCPSLSVARFSFSPSHSLWLLYTCRLQIYPFIVVGAILLFWDSWQKLVGEESNSAWFWHQATGNFCTELEVGKMSFVLPINFLFHGGRSMTNSRDVFKTEICFICKLSASVFFKKMFWRINASRILLKQLINSFAHTNWVYF